MKTLHAGLLVFVVLKLVGAVPLASFYTFGSSAGDTTLHRNDDGYSPLISLSTAFPYFGTNHRAVYVRPVQNYAVYMLRASCLTLEIIMRYTYVRFSQLGVSYLAMRILIVLEANFSQIFCSTCYLHVYRITVVVDST